MGNKFSVIYYQRRLIFLACLFIPLIVNAQPQTDTLFIKEQGEYPIARHLYIFPDSNIHSPEFIYDSTPPGNFIRLFPGTAFNNTTSLTPYYWLLVTVKNDLLTDESFYYWLNSPGLNVVKAYSRRDHGKFLPDGIAGLYIPLSEKQNKGYDAEFNFVIKKGETRTILLFIDNSKATNAFFVPQFADANTFKNKQIRYFHIMGIILGIMLISFIINLFLGITLAEKIHYLYALYILCLLYEVFTLEGVIQNYIGSNNFRFLAALSHIFPSICIILMTRIMNWFLQQNVTNSYFYRILTLINILLGTISILYIADYFFPFGPQVYNYLQMTLASLVGIQLLLIISSTIEKIIQGSRLAWLYLFATTWLLVGLFEYVIMFLGFNVVELVKKKHPNDLQIGIIIEVVVVFLAIIYRYQSYKREKESLLIEVTQHQKGLLEKIGQAEEEERKRIARDLHDDVGATLSTLHLLLSSAPTPPEKDIAMKTFHEKAIMLSFKAANDVRNIAHNLTPTDLNASGLFAALTERTVHLNSLQGPVFELVLEGQEEKLSEILKLSIYRIITELTVNIFKHSRASHAAIQVLIEEQGVQLITEDNGVGFELKSASEGIGLKNIRKRIAFLNGTLQIDSGQHGTFTIVKLPLQL